MCRERLRQADVAALYAGLPPAAVETVASTVVYFYLYSSLKQAALSLQRRRGGDGEFGVGASLLVASLAGAGNMLVTTPAQVGSGAVLAGGWGAWGCAEGWEYSSVCMAPLIPPMPFNHHPPPPARS